MTIILNSEVLDNIVNDNTLKILKRNQKIEGNCNYYFTPNIGLNLYNSRVKFVDKKFIVFEFDKYKNFSLLALITRINDVLKNKVRSDYSELFTKEIYNLFSEDENTFTLRCYLPNYNGKYSIYTNFGKFNIPRVGCCYNVVTIEIRNIWKNGDKYGFNNELKSVSMNFD